LARFLLSDGGQRIVEPIRNRALENTHKLGVKINVSRLSMVIGRQGNQGSLMILLEVATNLPKFAIIPKVSKVADMRWIS
jgi:hypothetical protein